MKMSLWFLIEQTTHSAGLARFVSFGVLFMHVSACSPILSFYSSYAVFDLALYAIMIISAVDS